MPDREDKHSIHPSHHADIKEHGLLAALDALKSLNASPFLTDELAPQITARIRAALGVQGIALWLANDLRTSLSLKAYSCINHVDILPKNYFYNLKKTSVITDCLNKNKPSLHKKYELAENDPRSEVLAKDLAGALLPLRSSEGAFGVLELITTADDPIEKSELDLLEVVTAQVALLLLNRQSLDRMTHQSALHKKLYEITSKINHAKDYESILQITVEEVCTALNLPSATMRINLAAVDGNPASHKEHNA